MEDVSKYRGRVIPMDLYKPSYQVRDISDYFNVRKGDSNLPLPIRYEKNQIGVTNTEGFRPFAEGRSGVPDDEGHLNEDNSTATSWIGKTSDLQEGGLAVLRLPDEFFPNVGIFEGYFGLINEQTGQRYTAAKITFTVAGDNRTMVLDNTESTAQNALAIAQETQEQVNKLDKDINDRLTRIILGTDRGTIETVVNEVLKNKGVIS
ncbi:hypothetical protein IV38_GL000119 [Lactobacillus selangorensis]|uniref:Uncharacterized protein n=1 Tax=Lactobacillus selangorensis TaxID=81857 RepID=A0A0R2FUV2_9LACO|nr:hypothetical protein [Lactobacillus selangorensis]KRN29239.1 hypothetical protein IV38_GL000119 [Lactobacillus selangorensis]KRN31403.1 hypothetical protein IV40_GL001399 [Lactobacillus selangorensis]